MNTTRSSRPRLLCCAAATPLLLAALSVGCTAFDDREADGGYLNYAHAARLCARIFSCGEALGADFAKSLMQSTGIPAEDRSFSACMSWFAGPISERPRGVEPQREILASLVDAGSCEDARDLLAIQYLPEAGSGGTGSGGDGALCTGAGGQCTDDGAAAVDCDKRQLIRCDDPRMFEENTTCGLRSAKRAWCKTSACGTGFNKWNGLSDVPTCQGASVLRICDQKVAINDGSDTEMRIRCDSLGLTCRDALVDSNTVSGLTMAICTSSVSSGFFERDRTGACNEPLPTSCQLGGSSVVVCALTMKLRAPFKGIISDETFAAVQSVFDCEARGLPIGFQCHDAGPSTSLAYCARADADACTPDDYADVRCDGDELAVCLAGRRDTVDCAAAGLRCRDRVDGSPRSAHCAFPE